MPTYESDLEALRTRVEVRARRLSEGPCDVDVESALRRDTAIAPSEFETVGPFRGDAAQVLLAITT